MTSGATAGRARDDADRVASAPVATVVVPAWNAEKTLSLCLDSIFASQGISYEVILVNDASTDRTEEIALGYPCRVISLESNIMAANCRNLAVKHARGEVLVFFDADEVMRPDTVRRYAETLQAHPEIDAVVGSLAPDTPMPGFFSKFKNLQHHHVHQMANPEGATLDSGRTAIRRHVFEECGGFEPAFAGASIEDIALGYKLRRRGHRIRFQPDIQVTHLKSYTFTKMMMSDILHRAIPWTGLMIRERIWRSDLNTKGSNIASVALSWLIPLALTLGLPWGALVSAAALATIWLLNARFLAVCLRQFGTGFLVRSLLFLPVMYFYHGVGLLAGLVTYALGGSVARKREAPQAVFDVREGPRAAGGKA
jgi:glycosyltransferase involved in cell wall biosynthesis